MTDQELLNVERLIEAFLAAKDKVTMSALVSDLLTEKQIEQCVRKLYAVYKLSFGAPYEFLVESCGLSSAIIAGIAKRLKDPNGGYNLILPKLYPSRFGDFDDTDPELEEFESFLATAGIEEAPRSP